MDQSDQKQMVGTAICSTSSRTHSLSAKDKPLAHSLSIATGTFVFSWIVHSNHRGVMKCPVLTPLAILDAISSVRPVPLVSHYQFAQSLIFAAPSLSTPYHLPCIITACSPHHYLCPIVSPPLCRNAKMSQYNRIAAFGSSSHRHIASSLHQNTSFASLYHSLPNCNVTTHHPFSYKPYRELPSALNHARPAPSVLHHAHALAIAAQKSSILSTGSHADFSFLYHGLLCQVGGVARSGCHVNLGYGNQ
jgi:hypothetical protein